MTAVPVFISFDYDHDQDLKNLLVGQSRHPDSPFDIIDQSVKVATPGWTEDARRRIRRATQVIVICGEFTDTATGVNTEIRIARDEAKPYFLINGRPNGVCENPQPRTIQIRSIAGLGTTSKPSSPVGVDILHREERCPQWNHLLKKSSSLAKQSPYCSRYPLSIFSHRRDG